ncbi:MAG: transposase [Chloroflexota bacterium]|nr:MAG: transposase [Chloroflexota bacterium]
MALYVRELTADEQTKIERLTRSQSAPLRLIERAWIIKLSADGMTVPAIAQRLDLIPATVRLWVTRFNAIGLAGLEDAPRSGRPRIFDEDVRSRVIGRARGVPPKPENGEVPPTCHWTLDRLEEELNKDGVPIKRSQIRRILKAEHVKWQKPRTWLNSDDPQFAEKRGPSSGSMSPHQPAVRS